MISTETSKDIIVNGTRVTCYSDGSVNVHSPEVSGPSEHSATITRKGTSALGWG